jgi:hypothetical protein
MTPRPPKPDNREIDRRLAIALGWIVAEGAYVLVRFSEDLDAMHRVEEGIAKRGLKRQYGRVLTELVNNEIVVEPDDKKTKMLPTRIDECLVDFTFALIHATAAQRAAAALEVLEGKDVD